jgi:hypothetical protein
MDEDDTSETTEGLVDEEAWWRERRAKALAQWQRLRRGTLRPADIVGALVAIGKGGLVEAREDVERFLRAEDSEDRRAALIVLGLDFGLSEYAATALDFLQHDQDVYCRLTAATVVGALARNTGDAEMLGALAQVVRSEREDSHVRKAAYAAIWAILAYEPRQQFAMATADFRFPEDVDWSLVDRYLPATA